MLFIGLDHSLTAFGAVALHSSWEQDWRRVRRITLTTPPGEQVARRAALARDVAEWVRRQAEHFSEPLTAVQVFMEGGLFMRGKADTIRSQERLAGVVEHEIARPPLELKVTLAQQTAVRSLFAGPSIARGRGSGDACQELLRELHKQASYPMAAWDEAELDAFLVAQHGAAEAGELFVSVAPPVVESEKPKRARKVA